MLRNRGKVWLALAAFVLASASLAVSSLLVSSLVEGDVEARIPAGVMPRVLLEANGIVSSATAISADPARARADDEPPTSVLSDGAEVARPTRKLEPDEPSRAARTEREAARVLVRARDRRTGRPINGAWVEAAPGDRWPGSAIARLLAHSVVPGPPSRWATAAQGNRALEVALTRLTGSVALGPFEASAGAVTGSLWHPRYEGVARWSVDLAQTTTAELSLETRRLGKLSGTIGDGKGGAPKRASLWIRGGDRIAEVSTDDVDTWAAGGFRYDLAPGSYRLAAAAPGFLASAWSAPVDVSEDAAASVDLVLSPEGRLEGFVDLPELHPSAGSGKIEPDGEPLELVLDVAGRDAPDAPFETRRATLDVRGRFSLGELASGPVFVRPHGATDWTTAYVLEGSTTRGVLMTLSGDSAVSGGRAGACAGIVRDAGGQPIAGALVRVVGLSATSDAHGLWSLSTPAALLCPVVVSKKGFRTAVVTFDLGRGALGVPLEVVLEASSP